MSLRLIGFVLILFLVALSVPLLVDSPGEDVKDAIRFESQEETVINDRLQIFAADINPNDDEAEITLTDIETLDSQTETIQEGENATFDLGDETVVVEVLRVVGTSDEDVVDVEVVFSPTYGWTETAKTAADNFGVIMVALTLIIFVSFVFVAVRGGGY